MQVATNNLSTFRVLFLVKGILTLCFSIFFIFYAFIGTIFGNIEDFKDLDFNPGIIFMVIGAIGFFFTIIFGVLTLIAAKNLKDVKGYNFIFVVAILNCLTGILGILLGVFTLVELTKPHIKQLFEDNKHSTL